MERTMSTHTVGAVARMAGVTVRTLHHYDEIGLLSPSGRSDAGYRRYGDADLDRLQRILLRFGRSVQQEERQRWRPLRHAGINPVAAGARDQGDSAPSLSEGHSRRIQPRRPLHSLRQRLHQPRRDPNPMAFFYRMDQAIP